MMYLGFMARECNEITTQRIYNSLFIIYRFSTTTQDCNTQASKEVMRGGRRQIAAAPSPLRDPPPFGRKAMGVFGTKGGNASVLRQLQMIHRAHTECARTFSTDTLTPARGN